MGLNVYEIVTERILESLEKGTVPWRQPWASSLPKNLVSKKPYRGVNVFLLGAMGFTSPYFLSYKQAAAKGGQVRKGEKATPVVFWKVIKKDGAGRGDKENGKIFILRYYNVFNVTQCDGLEIPAEEGRHAFSPLEECDQVVSRYEGAPALIKGGERACYIPSRDTIMVPEGDRFASTEEYYSTLFHEMTHSTGAESRLNRKGITDPIRFASHDYSFEELVAECGAAFLCAHTGIVNRTLDNSVAYIASWAKKLRSEPKWIVEASSQAAKACDHIMGIKYIPTDDSGDE